MSTRNNKRLVRARETYYIAQQGKCWLCGQPMRMDVDLGRHPLAASWDHITPRSKGGTRGQDNLMLAHRRCNRERSDREDVRAIEHRN
jgi:5-methylcytosine-specific restriction endonuclease McrA